MKQAIQLTTIFLILTAKSWTAEPSAAVKEAVLNAENQWKTAVLNADGKALDSLLSPDLSYTHSSAKTQTKEQFIQDVVGRTNVYKSIDFQDTKLRQYGTAVVITHSVVIVSGTATSHLYLTEVWAQEGQNWQMVSRQATKIP